MQAQQIVFVSWRDTENPEGGGAERFLEQMAEGLAEAGARVTVVSARFPGGAKESFRGGVRYVRTGSKTTVYPQALRLLATGRLGRPDVVVDVQNGMPFFTPLATRSPVVVLVHHVHREQWPVVYPGLSGRFGWWVERWLAPRLYRRSTYVAVSSATRDELAELGVHRERVRLVHNGTDPAIETATPRAEHPTICVVGRLVPHKQVEHAMDAVARLSTTIPDLRLVVVGDGWWSEALRGCARDLGIADRVEFTGHVDEIRKHEIYASAWVMALPSLKEGWGLVVGEAGAHSVPTVAYHSAGGTRESVSHGESGILVDDFEEFVEALRVLLLDTQAREDLAHGALVRSTKFGWQHSREQFAAVLDSVVAATPADLPQQEDPR